MPSKDTTNKIVAALTFVVVVGSIASYSLFSQPAASTPTVTVSPIVSSIATNVVIPSPVITPANSSIATISPLASTVPTAVQAHVYKDGSYNVVGDYMSPGGAEHIGVTLTIKDDVVVDSQVITEATLPISKRFQMDFANGYKQFVTGKKLSEINLSEVSGSSLTPEGFNNALAKIKAQARA